MSDFPKTRHEMLRAGYKQTGNGVCKGCNADIEWWKTTNGKSMPFDPIRGDNVEAVVHWATCPKSADFKSAAPAASAPPQSKSVRSTANPEAELRALRTKHNARVAVLVLEDGSFTFWRNGIDAEDLRQDLIAAGNFVRSEINKKEDQPR